MNKANQYNLLFKVVNDDNLKLPTVHVTNNSILSLKIASHLYNQGVKATEMIRLELYSQIDLVSSGAEPIPVDGGMEVDSYILTSPLRVGFDDDQGGYVTLPYQDFFDITQEWMDFLNSLPFEHYLSDK